METFKVAAVQMNALKGRLEHNLEVHRRFARRAARAGCTLVLFPELSTTAHYGDESVTEFAEEAGAGPVYETMLGLAAELDLIISYGFCEVAHGTHYNSQALVGPAGLIGVQRKVHASWDEYFHFRMGRTLEVFDLGFCRVGTLVCFDTAFFEAWRVLALKGAEVILMPHAARIARGKRVSRKKQLAGLKARNRELPGKAGVFASDNCVFAVSCNQADYNGHSTHGGGAYAVGPDGRLIAKARVSLDDLMITADLDAKSLAKARSRCSVMRLRRPEMYGELTEMI